MSRDQVIKSTTLGGLLAGMLFCAISCKTENRNSSDVKGFSWDEDLTPSNGASPACGDTLAKPVTPASTSGTAAPSTPQPDFCQLNKSGSIDPQFCVGLAPGTCFSLILRIPTKDLISDIGLNALSLGSQSKDVATRLQEACQAAWSSYQNQYKKDFTHATRMKFVQNIAKMRCIFNFISEEYIIEDAKLADNEVGISVRLTKFSIDGVNRATSINALNLATATTVVNTNFRSTYLYAGSKLSSGGTPWQSVQGFGVAPYSVARNIDSAISWSFSLGTLMQDLSSIDLASLTDAALKSFVVNAKNMVSGTLAGKSPPTSALVLVGIGYNTLKQICGNDSQKCQTSTSVTSKLGGPGGTLPDFVPSSEANEAFRMGLIKSIDGILDTFFTTAATQPLEKTLGLDRAPLNDTE